MTLRSNARRFRKHAGASYEQWRRRHRGHFARCPHWNAFLIFLFIDRSPCSPPFGIGGDNDWDFLIPSRNQRGLHAFWFKYEALL